MRPDARSLAKRRGPAPLFRLTNSDAAFDHVRDLIQRDTVRKAEADPAFRQE